jgi:hypothetical protein
MKVAGTSGDETHLMPVTTKAGHDLFDMNHGTFLK